nr:transposase, MuDR, MULE transposase domain protein [Tanacetum cinerariifolium]
MVMKKFNLEASYPLNLYAKPSLIDDNFDITDDYKVRFFDITDDYKDIQPDAYDKFCQVSPNRWSRAHFPLVRYNYLTSNSVEFVNACTVVYWKLPVLNLAKAYHAMVQDWYYKRRKLA